MALGPLKTKKIASETPSPHLTASKSSGAKTMCRQKLRNEVPAARNLALSCPPNRVCKVNPLLRFFFDSSHFSHCILPAPTTHRLHHNRVHDLHSAGGVHAFLRVQHWGCRMLFIRFVNRAVQAVWRSHHEGRKQARDSGHSPFRDPTGGRSPRARGSRSVAPLLQAANKLSSNPMAAAPRVTAPVSISIVVLPWRRNRS